MKFKSEEEYIGFLKDGFEKFEKTWSICGHMLLKLIVPIILMIISIIMISFSVAGIIALLAMIEDNFLDPNSVNQVALISGVRLIYGFILLMISLI